MSSFILRMRDACRVGTAATRRKESKRYEKAGAWCCDAKQQDEAVLMLRFEKCESSEWKSSGRFGSWLG